MVMGLAAVDQVAKAVDETGVVSLVMSRAGMHPTL